MSAKLTRIACQVSRAFDLKQGYRNLTGFRRQVKVAKNQKLLYTHGMGTWKSKNRHKYLLQYHIIFVCKYRKKLLVSRQISDDIKQFSYEICQRHSVIIRYMEKISPIFTKTILERTYLLDRWMFCLQCRKCIGRNAEEIYRKSRLRKKVTVDVKGI